MKTNQKETNNERTFYKKAINFKTLQTILKDIENDTK